MADGDMTTADASRTWTSYDRVKAALEHREADRVPFDLGGSVLTGMHRIAYANLRRYLGLAERPIEIVDLNQQLARIDQDVLDRLAVDVRAVDPGPAANAPLRTPITREGDIERFTDEWGITWRTPAGGGLYFDMCRHPLAGAESIADLERHCWPDPLDEARFATLAERADRFVHEERKAYILGRSAAGIFEVALWVRGFEQFFADLALRPSFADALLDIITDLKMQYWGKALETVGSNVLVVSEADDLAGQYTPLISPAMYRRFIMPRHQRLFGFIHERAHSRVHLFYHSCGAVKDLIPMLLDEGVQILNPVQVSARGMDTAELKRLYGDRLCFWGGGVDTQRVLPYGTRQQVRDEVRRRIDDLAPGGGFVFTTIHNTQADVPPENYMAMWEALQEFGRYR
ncbi:MAG: uroporphyrinogen decarboxylase family protein [Bacteroidales bacterium]